MVFQLLAVGNIVLMVYSVQDGLGRHENYITPTLVELLHVDTIQQIVGTLGICFVRNSIALLLLRLLALTYRNHRTTLWIGLTVNTLFTAIIVVLIGTQCVPLEKVWNRKVSGTCFPTEVLTGISRAVGGKFIRRRPAISANI